MPTCQNNVTSIVRRRGKAFAASGKRAGVEKCYRVPNLGIGESDSMRKGSGSATQIQVGDALTAENLEQDLVREIFQDIVRHGTLWNSEGRESANPAGLILYIIQRKIKGGRTTVTCETEWAQAVDEDDW